MALKAILFGSIGTIAETSEMQREAYNEAFREAGLDWHWDRSAYEKMIETPGGLRRIETYDRARGARIDAASLHARKTEIFQNRLSAGVALRPGVHDLVVAAKTNGIKLALCSTTDALTVSRLVRAARPALPQGAFDFLGDAAAVSRPKPDSEIFIAALRAFAVAAVDAVAIEDSPESAAAAMLAGIPLVAFPGARHAHRLFPGAQRISRRLEPAQFGLTLAGKGLAAAE